MVSEHTVHRHVTNLLRKLDLPTRTAAAALCGPVGAARSLARIARTGYPARRRRWPVLAKPRPHPEPRVRACTDPILQAAALARIDEMATSQGAQGDVKAQQRAMWALGDYHRFARHTVWGFGPVLVEACGISAGQRVLDVAAGSGNVAIRAAEAGAQVVAVDLTPENFEAGRREARARGVELEWVEGDAESLPFGDGEFDVVTSSVGAIFAPDHQAVADELVRVCRPGGTIGMINFTPEGLAGEFFALFGRHAPPPPPGAPPPVLWGSEAHLRELFGDRLASLELTRRRVHRAQPRRPSRLLRLLQADVRARGRALREPHRRARPARGPRSGLPGLRDPRKPGATRRAGRVRLRVPAGRRPHAGAGMTTEGFVGFRGCGPGTASPATARRDRWAVAGAAAARRTRLPERPVRIAGGAGALGPPVIRYDQIGCGRSDRPHDPSWWTVETFLEELATVRRELGLDNVHLLGWSWGGMLALEYLLTRPEGIASVVLTSTPPSIPLYVEEARRLRDGLPEHVKRTMQRFEHSYRARPPRPTTKVSDGMSTRTAQRSARVIRPLMRLMATRPAARLASWASVVPALRRAAYEVAGMQWTTRYEIHRPCASFRSRPTAATRA